MAIPRVHRLVRTLGGAAALALAGAGCTAYPSAPSEPAFDTDVRPIFLAHCTRCHGAGPDGGALNSATGSYDETTVGSITSVPSPCLQIFGVPSADAGAPSGCSGGGANKFAAEIGSAIVADTPADFQMPPAPAPHLDDYEVKVIQAWVAEPTSSRKCSNSPNPDPALNCIAGSYP
ncbi:MAG TPA: hypothetical protein VHO06_06620 [Polyangia bacterium]|nr:hypothetical protein [Polyangia bacterium]